MNKDFFKTLSVVLVLLLSHVAESRVYRNKPVGEYQVSFNLEEHKGQSLLSFMKKVLYPAIKTEAPNRSRRDHVDSIARGEGVELRLSHDITTYHVKYKMIGESKAERSGRSFGAVGGNGRTVSYLADASYKHFLSTLEEVLEDEAQAQLFYQAILKIMIDSNPTDLELLNNDAKKVAADYVAVLIAEQYRRLIEKDGQALVRRPEWDNAHFHVTLLGNFHAGQSQDNKGMFYHGRFSTEVYHQIERTRNGKVCAYRDKRNKSIKYLEKRDFNLTDYWQFNAECARSGVNITRRDFVRMSDEITDYMKDNHQELIRQIRELTNKKVNVYDNINDELADYIISDYAPEVYENAELLVSTLVEYLTVVRNNADTITDSL